MITLTIGMTIGAILSLLAASIEFERAMRAKRFEERLESALDTGNQYRGKWEIAPEVTEEMIEEWRVSRWD